MTLAGGRSGGGGRPDVLISGGRVVTMDPGRREFGPGFVAVSGGRIVDLGPMAECPYDRAAKTIDASGRAVLPGFVNAHTHAVYNLLRGGISDDRGLYDWLLNVVHPGLKALSPEHARTAAELFCLEAIRAGITTFVDNADSGRFPDVADATLSAYERFGVRAIYARMFADFVPDAFQAYTKAIVAKEPRVHHYLDNIEETARALDSIEELMRAHHGRAEGRIGVWPAPGVATFTTREGLLGAKELAKRWGTKVTIHVAESALDREQAGMSSIEYLATIGFLGPDVLAAHCVQVNPKDIRILAAAGVRIAHNPVSNLFLACGVAPISEMAAAGLTISIGTDDPNCNSSVNMISDMKFAVLAQKGRYLDAEAITAERALEMATIEGAAALGMEESIGSLEPGKRADLITIDLARPQMVPLYSVASAIVYQANGDEVNDVLVDGRLLMQDRVLSVLAPEEERALLARAQQHSEEVVSLAGLDSMRDRGWRSRATG